MILEPLGDQVLAKQVEAKETSPGGIIIPEKVREKPKEAVVVSTGPGKRLETGEIIPVQVEEGNYIIFAHYSGQEVEVDNEPYLLLKSEEILAKVRR